MEVVECPRMKIDVQYKWIERLFKKFPDSKVFLVGGSVRDAILKRRAKDDDFVVLGVPDKDLEEFLSTCGEVNLVGKQFGVFKFKETGSGKSVDIALPRTEKAGGSGKYRDFEVQTDKDLPIEEDLSRRDFTINSIAWDVKHLKLIDPFEGQKDLQEKIIRTVGDPDKRFQEDNSRMLRALRFACQLEFEIEQDTWKAITQKISTVTSTVPAEVIGEELLKGLRADPKKCIEYWDKSGALKEVVPELIEWDNQALESLTPKASMEAILAVLLYPLGSRPAGAIIRKLKLSAAIDFKVSDERVEWLIDHFELLKDKVLSEFRPSELQKLLFSNNYNREDLLTTAAVITKSPNINAYAAVEEIEPMLSGEKIMELLVIKEGPEVGKVLDHLIDLQGSGKLTSPQQAEDYLKENRNDPNFLDPLRRDRP